MFIESVDSDKCILCGKCIDVCGPEVFQRVIRPLSLPTNQKGEITDSNSDSNSNSDQREFIIRNPNYIGCISCGHCVAICPTDAIEYSRADPPFEAPEVANPKSVPYSTTYSLLRARRSIRKYDTTPLDRSEIEAVLEAMRYAPSASNQQAWQYIVLTDPAEIARISENVVGKMRIALKILSNRLVQKLFLFGQLREAVKDPGYLTAGWRIITRAEAGEDPILFNSPCVIILHSPKYGNLAGNDAGISFTYGMLAAQARGLGTCWIGFAQEVFQRFPKFRRRFGIPRNHQVWGVMTLGRPRVKYIRAPPRKTLQVRWFEFGVD
ncbi:MAG: nitroreductase family protein [Promethearchaeota archaeon]